MSIPTLNCNVHFDSCPNCGFGNNVAPQNAKELAATTANSDYAAALKIYGEYVSSGVSTIDHFVTFPSWCEERLNALKAAHCA